MSRIVPVWLTTFVMLLVFSVLPKQTRADTPACTCSLSSLNVTLPGALSCLSVTETSLDVCYGTDILVEVQNSCTFDVVVKSIPNLNDDGHHDETIEAGQSGAWQQALDPRLTAAGETPVELQWTVGAEGADHTVELTFVGSCTDDSESGGCQSGPEHFGPVSLAFLVLVFAIRRKRPALL